MPEGFTFRPNEINSASEHSRRILNCLLCGNVVKRSKTGVLHNRGYVGCRNNRLLGLVSNIGRGRSVVTFVASFYSRLAEHFNLQGDHLTGNWRRYQFKSRAEASGIKSLLYQSMFTTVQAHYKIGKMKVIDKCGQQPGGGLKVPNEDRPPMFRFHENDRSKKFRPWPCVQSQGCCLVAADQTSSKTSAVPEEMEAAILTLMGTDQSPRRLDTLEKHLQQQQQLQIDGKEQLLSILQQLRKEGKVKLNSPLGNTTITNQCHHNPPAITIELTPLGHRCYWKYNNQIPEKLEQQILTNILGDGKNRRRFVTLERDFLSMRQQHQEIANDGKKLLAILKQFQQEGKVSFVDIEARPNRPTAELTNIGRRRLIYLSQQKENAYRSRTK
ncbi:hypothetical protein ACHAWF_006254 [Thalassiosira exigua]